MSKVHDLINYERKKRGIPTAYWSREMAKLAQSQANYCAKVGHLVHSSRFAFRGGENLAQGGSNFSPRAIVNTWLSSRAGHREYLLSPRVKKMGVGIAKSRGRTYVAWAFSDEPPTYPDCPYYKARGLGGIKLRRFYFKPKTNWGKWSTRLIVAFAVFLASFGILVASGQRGGNTFFSNPILTIPILLAGTSGIAAFITGLISIVRRKERSISVYLAVTLGLIVLVFVLGEIIFPH